ncbi:hypothetical protein KIN20_024469 [Parelaphostrongylus tenuis]|uniref:Uncharacterized protein n=1 Tax=Parelaphostrongylus tenuis TaxID=148309 RepID=A0AAD5MTH7_PARTN|nr:hypothetical protein KIN20_024469 [Parelaphostrongylus tenuis]
MNILQNKSHRFLRVFATGPPSCGSGRSTIHSTSNQRTPEMHLQLHGAIQIGRPNRGFSSRSSSLALKLWDQRPARDLLLMPCPSTLLISRLQLAVKDPISNNDGIEHKLRLCRWT